MGEKGRPASWSKQIHLISKQSKHDPDKTKEQGMIITVSVLEVKCSIRHCFVAWWRVLFTLILVWCVLSASSAAFSSPHTNSLAPSLAHENMEHVFTIVLHLSSSSGSFIRQKVPFPSAILPPLSYSIYKLHMWGYCVLQLFKRTLLAHP